MKRFKNKIILELERELSSLGLLDKTREIYCEMGLSAAMWYIKSSYHLLSKVYHPDLNPENIEKANKVQKQLNHVFAGQNLQTVRLDLSRQWGALEGLKVDSIIALDLLEHFQDD